jgi:hypothetical protein
MYGAQPYTAVPYSSIILHPVIAPSGGPGHHLLVSYTPGTDRNDFTGEVGVRLGIGGANLPISWLGARSNGVGGTRTINVYEWFADTLIATGTIDYTGVALGSFAWVSVTPFTLLASGYYAVLMPTTASDGKTWTNPGATVFTGMTNVYGCYRSGGTLGVTGVDEQFVGLDLGWDDVPAGIIKSRIVPQTMGMMING